jgi:LacI family transcriptional regulator
LSPKPLSLTSHDIAREAGVSQSTVSRALRGDPRVDPETAARIVRVADRRGYMPNATARSLVTRRTRTIAVVVADIKNPFYPELVEALHEALGRSGYRMVLVNERTDTRGQAGLAELYRGGGADGALFVSVTIERRVAALVTKSPVPSVLLNRDVDGADVDRVMSDNAGGAAQVAEHLHGLGHRRVAFIAGPANTSTSRDREAGLSGALAQRGAPLDPAQRRVGEFTHRSGYQWATDLLDRPDRPTAIFCANDVVAFGALDAARNLGIDVPGAVSIAGFDDVPMASWGAFGLTTVRQPLTDMARDAVRVLIDRVEGRADSERQRLVFPTHLVQRTTTGPPPDGARS